MAGEIRRSKSLPATHASPLILKGFISLPSPQFL